MSGSATFTIVMSSSSMNVARQTASKVHHLRSIVRGYLDGQVAELLADASVEARPRQLGQQADAVGEAHLEPLAGRQVGDPFAVDRDLDRLAAGGVEDVEDVGGGDDESSRGDGDEDFPQLLQLVLGFRLRSFMREPATAFIRVAVPA